MRNKKSLHASAFFMAKLVSAFAVAGFLVACDGGETICEEPIEIIDSSSSSIDVIQSSSSEEANSNSSSSQQVLSSTSSNDTLSSSIVTPESSSSEMAISSSSSPTVQSSSSAVPGSSSWTLSSDDSRATEVESSSSSPYLWHDEFNAIDTAKWTFEIGTGSSGWGNNEWEYYTDRSENAYVQDGILHIRANKEDYEGSKYTSARIITKGKFSFTYGTVEARIALPKGKGIWPAFWMLGENIDEVSWPKCGEIDIIEAVNEESVVYGTHHWYADGQADYGNSTKEYYGTHYDLVITEFHNYKMTWDSKMMTMYVDDFKYQEIAIDGDGGIEAFRKPFFFVLNVAVGGQWPGFDIDDSQFPNEMLVDYIRVYK